MHLLELASLMKVSLFTIYCNIEKVKFENLVGFFFRSVTTGLAEVDDI